MQVWRSAWPRYVAGVLALAAVYYGTAKAGQALRYTGSVAAVWPPVGLGIAALYLWGLRWWPGVFIGDLVVNLQLLVGHDPSFSLTLHDLTGVQARMRKGGLAAVAKGELMTLLRPQEVHAIATARERVA